MLRDVAEDFNTVQRNVVGADYLSLRNLSGFRLDVPRQIDYMLSPEYASTRRYLAQVQNIRQRYRDMVSYRFRFNLKFCMDSSFTEDMKRNLITYAMNLAREIHETTLDINATENDLRLQIPMFGGRSFYGLYEIPNANIIEGIPLMDLIFPGRGVVNYTPVLSKYNRYTRDFNTFEQRDYNKALNVFTNNDPEVDASVIRREIDQFEEVGVIESPGLNLNTLERLLAQGTQRDHKKVLYVRWTFRLGLLLSLSELDDWLRNVNLSHLPDTRENVERWREFFNVR